jgi:hypothetical protein
MCTKFSCQNFYFDNYAAILFPSFSCFERFRIYLGEKMRNFLVLFHKESSRKNLIYAKTKISQQYLLLTENMYGNKVDGFPKSNISRFPTQTKSLKKEERNSLKQCRLKICPPVQTDVFDSQPETNEERMTKHFILVFGSSEKIRQP